MTTGTDLEHQQNGAPIAGHLDLFQAGPGVAAAMDASAVVHWAQRLAVVRAAVDMVVETPFVPAAYWPLPRGVKLKDFPNPYLVHPAEDAESYGHRRRIACATATLAALHGERYGWDPSQSWRALYVVSGRVGIGYEGVTALLSAAGYRWKFVERSRTRCAIEIAAPGGEPQPWEFTFEDAVEAGYVPKQGPNAGKDYGGNQKYLTDPKTMLLARCFTTYARVEASHVLAGMAVVELMNDEPQIADPVQITATASAPAAPGASAARLRELAQQPQTQQEPSDPQPAGTVTHLDGPGGPDDPRPIDEATWRKINARFVDLGVKGQGQAEQRLRVIGEVLGRTVAQGRDLNAAEAQLVLDNLAGEAGVRLVNAALGAPGEVTASEAEDALDHHAQADVERRDPAPDPWRINFPAGGADPDADEDLDDEQPPLPGDDR